MIIKKNIDSLLADPELKKEIVRKLMENEYSEDLVEITKVIPTTLLIEKRKTAIIAAIDAEEFYTARKIDVNKVFHQMLSKIKFDRQKLEHRYVDADGHSYFAFPDKIGLPIERFGKLKFYLMWMISGISPKEIDDLLDMADEALGNGIKDPKQAAVIGMVHEEIRGRKRLTIHTELLYNFLACQWVRDDEDPIVFNNQIQLEKVESFKRENAKGNSYFFFRQKELKILSSLFMMSPEEWNKFWQESLNSQKFLQAIRTLKYFSEKEEGE